VKILFILPSLNLYGGTPKKTLDLIKNIDGDFIVYTYDENYNEFIETFENAGATVFTNKNNITLVRHYIQLRKIINNYDIQLVQTQFFKGELLGFISKIIKKNIRLISAFVGPFDSSLTKKIIQNFIYRHVDFIIYVSNYVKKEKEKQFNILKSKNSKIIFNGSKRRASSDLNIKKNKLELLTIGGLNNWKNIPFLIDVVDLLKCEGIDFHLSIIGDGYQKNEIAKKIKKLNLTNSVTIQGYVRNVGSHIESCDIYLHPSQSEGFGIAVIEAMHAKKAIIVSDKGALPEIICNEFSGIIVNCENAKDWKNAILKIYSDRKYKNYIASNAQKIAEEKFSIEVFSQNYNDTYEKFN